MAQQAQVTSVEAIEAFRAQLVIFLSKARPSLEEVSSEVHRLRQWLQNDRRRFWEQELRLRRRKLEEAQQELFSAKLSKLQEASALQFMAVQRAKRAVQDAEAKLALLRKWEANLDSFTEPFLKQVDQTLGYLTTDMAKAVAYLAQTVKSLEAYADVAPGPAKSTPSPAAGGSSGDTGKEAKPVA